MNEYIIVIFSSCALVGLFSFIFISEKQKKAAKFALGIILVSSIISPIVSIAGEIADIELEYEMGATENHFGQTAEESFCRGIELALAEELSLSANDISVSASEFSVPNLNAGRVIVTLYGEARLADFSAIRRFVEDNKFGECEVRLGFE